MEGIINFELFLISAVVFVLAPGPDFLYVTTRGIADGNRAGVISAIGVSCGLLVHTLFAAFGLSAIIRTSEIIYSIIKYAGAAYLIFIGIKSFVTTTKPSSPDGQSRLISRNDNHFRQGLLTNVFNPKAIVTFMAFMPQFVKVNSAQPIKEFLILGGSVSFISVTWFIFVGYFAGSLGALIKRNRMIQNGIKYVSGTIMIFLGLRLAMKRD